MTSVELAKQKSNNSDWKRLSINNLFNQKHERCDKQERSSQKQLDKKGKNRKKIQYNFKQYNFEPFDLKQIENNLALIKSNRKFSSLLDTLRQYNQKLKENNQTDIINYKLYEFFYSTLRICNTKTNTEVQFYLRQLNTWKQQYNHKRQFLIHRKNKKKDNKPEQELIRQTFKSYLPSQINQYERKNCIFSKNQQSDDKNRRKNYKMPNGKPFYDSDGQDTEQYMKKLQDKEHEKDRKKQETRLPDLRTYQNQLKKMRKIIQDRQEKQLLQDLMKNKTRIQTQSANNFYKPMRNRNDIFNKTSASKFQTELFFKKPEGQEENNNESSKIQGAEQNLKATNAQKQNHRIVVNSTSLGFYEIKKSNLEKALGVKKMKTTSTNFPKFFMNHDTSYNSLTQKIDEQQNQKDPNVGNYQQKITNIMGMHLLRNPFEITKIKRQKKKK